MILLRQALLTICLAFIVSISMVFRFVSGESLAATLPMPNLALPQHEIVAINQSEGMAKNNIKYDAENLIAKMADSPKDRSAEKADKFEADTQKAIINSIENPDYQPNRASKQAERQNRKSNEDMEVQVHNDFKKASD